MKALGLIETIGLVTAFEAADAALKAANVKLLGYENTKGGGRITVKFVGDVGAVQAAVSAGVAAALRIGRIESSLVIPRPHQEIQGLIAQIDRGPVAVAAPAGAPEPAPVTPPAPATVAKPKAAAKPAVKPKSAASKAKRAAKPPVEPAPAEAVADIPPAAAAAAPSPAEPDLPPAGPAETE